MSYDNNPYQARSVPQPPHPPYPQQEYPLPGYPKSNNTAWIVVGILVACGFVFLCVIGLLFALLLPAVQAAREAARNVRCANNMAEIGVALHNYHETHKSLPPAYSVDENGKPLHSWRVLLLPYLELGGGSVYKGSVYEDIKLDEPWDSPHNSRFHHLMPQVFACTSRQESEWRHNGMTPYKMIIGPDTISDGPHSVSFAEVSRGLSQTIAVVETTKPVCWMQPVDLPQSALAEGIIWTGEYRDKNDIPEAIGSLHRGRAYMLLLDGTVKSASTDKTPPEILEEISKTGKAGWTDGQKMPPGLLGDDPAARIRELLPRRMEEMQERHRQQLERIEEHQKRLKEFQRPPQIQSPPFNEPPRIPASPFNDPPRMKNPPFSEPPRTVE